MAKKIIMIFLKQNWAGKSSVRIGLVFLVGLLAVVTPFPKADKIRPPIYKLQVDYLGSNIEGIVFVFFFFLLGAIITYVFLQTERGDKLMKKQPLSVILVFFISIAIAFFSDIGLEKYTGFGYLRASDYASSFYWNPYFCGQTRIPNAAKGIVKIESSKVEGTGFWVTDNLVLTDISTPDSKANIVTDNNEHQYLADLIQVDHSVNIALLRVNGDLNYGDHNVLKWRLHPSDQGEDVFVFGVPEGSKDTMVSGGIVAAVVKDGETEFVLTDAPTYSENYGGPMVDVCGKVMGVMVQTPYDEGAPNGAFGGVDLHNKLSDMIAEAENFTLTEDLDETEVLSEYYSLLGQGNFNDAYDLYSENLKTRVLFDGWKNSYANLFTVKIQSIEKLSPGLVRISFKTTDSFNDGRSEVVKEFSGTWSFVREDNLWKLNFSNIKEVPIETNF